LRVPLNMKYKFSAFIVSLIFIANLSFVSAVSGACSGHGGVDCSVGADTDGSVICADGWRNSSVSYSSMAKCAKVSAKSEVKTITPTIKESKVQSLFKRLKFW
jgi:hypothetical protein